MTRPPRRTWRSDKGAVDLASVMVSGVIIGIFAGAAISSVVATIPWAQDKTARSDIQVVQTAQKAARIGDGLFQDAAALRADKLISSEINDRIAGGSLTVAVGAIGHCYVLTSRSESGELFYATSAEPEIFTATGGTLPSLPCG